MSLAATDVELRDAAVEEIAVALSEEPAPQCEGLDGDGKTPCPDPAAWLIWARCCNISFLACDEHRAIAEAMDVTMRGGIHVSSTVRGQWQPGCGKKFPTPAQDWRPL